MPVQGEKLILGLSALLQLGKRAFAAEDEAAFGFLVVNETHLMTPYRQAVLWRYSKHKTGEVVAVSGSPEPNIRAPYVTWLTRVFSQESMHQHKTPICITAANVKGEEGEAWEHWLPAHGIWAPLISGVGERLGGLLLVKSVPWTDPEIKLIGKLADAYANAWELVMKRARERHGIQWKALFFAHRPWIRIGSVLMIVLICFLPVHQTALAPARVMAMEPAPVRAPMDGIVKQFHIAPNQMVKKGDLLFTLDEAALDNKLAVESKTFDLYQEEYRQILKQSVTDHESRAQKKILEKRMEKQAAEAEGVRILLNRIQVLAPRDGVALFDDVNHWVGKPVLIGERILEVADPKSAELEIHLPVSDAIEIAPDAKVILYPNMDPLNSWLGSVTRIGYNAQEMEGILSYSIKARFMPEREPPRIGLRGTAKIEGRQTTLFFYLFRHPMALLRQRLGL
ncbi:MAG: HlyD family efflux transporter periplasmic adaptor subunit [Magnetococcus sp. YQC-5]